MKKVLKVALALMMLMTLSCKSVFSKSTIKISLVDINTSELIKNADVQLYFSEKEMKLDLHSTADGFIEFDLNTYNEIKDEAMIVEVKSDQYNGESLGTNIYDEAIHVKQTLTRGASDWNTVSSSYVGNTDLPIYRAPGYGGLIVEMQISGNQSFSVGGYSYTSGVTLGNSVQIQSNINECWAYALANVGAYSVKQTNAAGAVRYVTTYSRPTSIKITYKETAEGMSANIYYGTLYKNQNNPFIILTNTSAFTFSANIGGTYYTVGCGTSSGTSVKYSQSSVGKYYTYEIYDKRVRKIA